MYLEKRFKYLELEGLCKQRKCHEELSFQVFCHNTTCYLDTQRGFYCEGILLGRKGNTQYIIVHKKVFSKYNIHSIISERGDFGV